MSVPAAGKNPRRSPGRWSGWLFGAVTVVPAMLAAAWLLPALPLLLAGRFSARPMVFMFAPLAAGLCYFAVRQLPTTWPGFPRKAREAQAPPGAREARETQASPGARETRETREARETQASPGARETHEARETQASPGARETHEVREGKEASEAREAREGKEGKQGKEGKLGNQGGGQRPVPWWAVVATVAVAVAFAAWQIAERTEQIIYLRDPSTYLEVGYWVAYHGSLPIPDSLAAFGGPHPGLGFASANYYPRGSGIVPQFMTGMPLVLAAAIWLGGIPAALVMTPLIGGCAVLSFGGLAGRLVGPRWAPAAAAILALSLPEQYTSRSTFSEPLAQVLLFGGLCLLADALIVTRGPRSASDWPGQDKVLAALGGLALGLTTLVRIDGLSDILPAVAFLGVLLAARRRQAIPFGAGLVIGVGYGLADGYLKSRPYLDLEAPSLRPLGLIVALVVLLTLAGVALTARPATRQRLTRQRLTKPRLSQRTTTKRLVRWLPAAAATLTVLIFIGFAVRPLVQTVAGETDPTSIAYVAELQKLAHLPVNGRDQYYQDTLYWVIWYLGAPAVLLGAFGLAILARRCTKALLTWKDPSAVARVWALPAMIAIWVIVTVLWRPAVSPDQPWASRRLVPFVLPGLILGALWAAAWLKDQASQLGRTKITSGIVASCCVASLLIPTALTTLDLGVTKKSGLTAHGMAFLKIGAGELTAVNGLCAAIGPDASVVILDSLTADRFAQIIRGICNTPAAVLQNPTRATTISVVQGIEGVGRRPVLLAQQQTELTVYGATPHEVVNLLTTQEAHNLTSPPTRTWGIHYTVWMSVPTSAAAGGPA